MTESDPRPRNPLLRVNNLTKRYKDENGEDQVILENLNLEVDKSEFLCLIGKSGCGKTTLLRCIAGFEPYEGAVFINGQLETKPNTHRVMVFQDFDQLLSWKTVEKNVQFAVMKKAKASGEGRPDKTELQRISDEYLELVDLADRKKHYPHQLSGGMLQRAAIARSLAVKPSIILMDEPFASLDAQTRANLQTELLRVKQKAEMTVMFVTHNIQEALTLGSRVILMGNEKGRFDIDIRPDLKQPVSPESEGFAHYWSLLNEGLRRKG